MTAFNRIVVILVALVLLAGSIITMLVATGATAPDSYGWFDFILQKAADASGGDLAGVIAVAVVIALISVVVLLIELSLNRHPAHLLISSSEEGITTINQESISLLAEKTAAAVQNVRDVLQRE
jgi:type IV secretory pathway VirB2 component (pilin)